MYGQSALSLELVTWWCNFTTERLFLSCFADRFIAEYKNSIRTPSEMRDHYTHTPFLHASSCDQQRPKQICKTPPTTMEEYNQTTAGRSRKLSSLTD